MKWETLIIAALGLFVSLGCSSARDPDLRPTAERPQDEETIRKVIDSFSMAFNSRNAQRLSELWHPDGDTRPGGRLISGRPAIQERYVSQLSSDAAKGTTHSHPGTITIRFVRPDVVIADGEYQISGARDAEGKELPAVRGFWTVVLTKEGDDWGFAAVRTAPAPSN